MGLVLTYAEDHSMALDASHVCWFQITLDDVSDYPGYNPITTHYCHQIPVSHLFDGDVVDKSRYHRSGASLFSNVYLLKESVISYPVL